MADEREGAEGPRRAPASEDVIQSGGRQQPLNAADEQSGPEGYPTVDRADTVERREQVAGESRSFDSRADAPAPRRSGGEAAVAKNDGWLGPGGDPAEGKP
jgi:hypothetical protein